MNTPLPLLLALLFISSFALSNAQAGYGMFPGGLPPPFAVKGKEFPPQNTFCIDPNTTCFGKTLTCPNQCPEFKPADPKSKACYIDCNNPTCEGGICKTRKPNCEGNGAACYDPRFVGGDGIMFYFHGKANHHFTLVSDSNLHINAKFIGIRPANRRRDFTWIQSLGIMFNAHTFTLSASPAAEWDPSVDHLSFTYDSQPVHLEEGHLSVWSADGLQVERTATLNSVTVTVAKMLELMVTAVPVTAEDNRIHKYGIPAGDCFSHLEIQFKFYGLSEKVEGVLGQTYRPDFKNPVKRGVAMPIMSGEDRYAVDSILSTNCKACGVFSPQAVVETVVDDVEAVGNASAKLDCSGKMSNGYGVVCRR